MLSRGTYPAQPKPRILDQTGATLVEALITASIIGGLALSIATVVNFANKASTSAIQTTDFNSLMSGINTIFNTATACADMFGGTRNYKFDPTITATIPAGTLVPTNNGLTTAGGAEITTYYLGTTPYLALNSLTGLKITGVKFFKSGPPQAVVSGSSYAHTVDLTVYVQKQLGGGQTVVGKSQDKRTITVSLIVSAPDGVTAGTVTGCSLSGTNSSIWTRTAPNVFLVNSTDNVGIGTSAPAEKLDVVGNIKASANITSQKIQLGTDDGTNGYVSLVGTGTLFLRNPSAGGSVYISTSANVVSDSGGIGGLNTGGSEYMRFNWPVADGAAAVAYKFNTMQSLANAGAKLASFQNQGVEKASIGASGSGYFASNVGIGTTGPQDKLHVMSGDIRTSSAVASGAQEYVSLSAGTINRINMVNLGMSTNYFWHMRSDAQCDGAGGECLVLYDFWSSNTSSRDFINISASNNSMVLGGYSSTGYDSGLGRKATLQIVVPTGGRWGAGNHGIYLHHYGTTAAASGIVMDMLGSGAGTADMIRMQAGGVGGFRVDDLGHTMVGSFSASFMPTGGGTRAALSAFGDVRVSGDLHVGGSIYVSDAAAVTSDARFKRDVESLADSTSLEKIEKLRPVRFEWDASKFPNGKAPDNRVHLGFLAQELDQVFPSMVDKHDAEHFYVHLEDLIAPIVDSVQSLAKWVRSLAAQVETIARAVADQAQRLARLERENTELKAQNARFQDQLEELKAALCESGSRARACAH